MVIPRHAATPNGASCHIDKHNLWCTSICNKIHKNCPLYKYSNIWRFVFLRSLIINIFSLWRSTSLNTFPFSCYSVLLFDVSSADWTQMQIFHAQKWTDQSVLNNERFPSVTFNLPFTHYLKHPHPFMRYEYIFFLETFPASSNDWQVKHKYEEVLDCNGFLQKTLAMKICFQGFLAEFNDSVLFSSPQKLCLKCMS